MYLTDLGRVFFSGAGPALLTKIPGQHLECSSSVSVAPCVLPPHLHESFINERVDRRRIDFSFLQGQSFFEFDWSGHWAALGLWVNCWMLQSRSGLRKADSGIIHLAAADCQV